MNNSSVTMKVASKKFLGKKSPRVNNDIPQPGCALARQLTHDKPQLSIPVTVSGVACKLCWWSCGEYIISKEKFCIL